MSKNVKKNLFTNTKEFLQILEQFIHLDPDPTTLINADPCGSGSETLAWTVQFLCRKGYPIHQEGFPVLYLAISGVPDLLKRILASPPSSSVPLLRSELRPRESRSSNWKMKDLVSFRRRKFDRKRSPKRTDLLGSLGFFLSDRRATQHKLDFIPCIDIIIDPYKHSNRFFCLFSHVILINFMYGTSTCCLNEVKVPYKKTGTLIILITCIRSLPFQGPKMSRFQGSPFQWTL